MHTVAERPRLAAEHDRATVGGTGETAPLRVLQVALGYYPYAGGLETHVHEVSRRMVAAGVQVTVLTVDTGRGLPAVEEVEGVQVRRVRALRKATAFGCCRRAFDA